MPPSRIAWLLGAGLLSLGAPGTPAAPSAVPAALSLAKKVFAKAPAQPEPPSARLTLGHPEGLAISLLAELFQTSFEEPDLMRMDRAPQVPQHFGWEPFLEAKIRAIREGRLAPTQEVLARLEAWGPFLKGCLAILPIWAEPGDVQVSLGPRFASGLVVFDPKLEVVFAPPRSWTPSLRARFETFVLALAQRAPEGLVLRTPTSWDAWVQGRGLPRLTLEVTRSAELSLPQLFLQAMRRRGLWILSNQEVVPSLPAPGGLLYPDRHLLELGLRQEVLSQSRRQLSLDWLEKREDSGGTLRAAFHSLSQQSQRLQGVISHWIETFEALRAWDPEVGLAGDPSRIQALPPALRDLSARLPVGLFPRVRPLDGHFPRDPLLELLSQELVEDQRFRETFGTALPRRDP